MRIRVTIADDEPLARERVRDFLAEDPEVEVVAECGDGVATVQAVEQHRPDLLFLDVQMPRLSGFEVLEALDGRALPAVIFTTAYDQHAIRAFEVSAVDYLLKPYNRPRFRNALRKARERIAQGRNRAGLGPDLASALAHWHGRGEYQPRIVVKSSDRILFLKLQEIDHVAADGNYVQIHAGKERHMIRETMTAMEERLTPSGFMRISRSILVNLGRVRELKPVGPGEYRVIVQSGQQFEMTCSLREFQERMGRT
jgi:two-component system LytT family response regulator